MSRVVVVGLGKSGIGAARVLAGQGEIVLVSEIKSDGVSKSAAERLVKDNVVEMRNVELGSHSDRFIAQAKLMVVSPGVSNDSLAIKFAEKRRIPIISELELAYSACPAPIIAVTGTSGKTTVTTLIGKMLRKAGRDAVVSGNIGNSLSSEIKRLKKDSIVVLEVSSFQLERIKNFKPKASIILNISENHLDRHRDMEEYISSKLRIFLNQDKDSVLFLNGRQRLLKEIASAIKCKVEFFDRYRNFRKKYNIQNENYLAAMSMAWLEGVSEDVMLEVISKFRGIEHRLEHVTTINGVDFINDSKATTVASVEWALKSIERNIVLIMGGRYKGGDFGRLKKFVQDKVDYIVAIGEARPHIKSGLRGTKEIIEKNDFDDAVRTAFKKTRKGGRVLLSPGCSSFDMFKNYEERGRIFKELCSRLSLEHPADRG